MEKNVANATQSDLLPQFVSTLVEEAAPLRIILFGSRSRGEARPDSDYNLLVLEESFSSAQKKQRSWRTCGMSWPAHRVM